MGRNKWDFAQRTLQFLLILGLGGWLRMEHHPSKLQGPASEQSLPPLQPVGRKGILYMHLLKFRHQGKMPRWLKRELRQPQLSDLGQMMPPLYVVTGAPGCCPPFSCPLKPQLQDRRPHENPPHVLHHLPSSHACTHPRPPNLERSTAAPSPHPCTSEPQSKSPV